MGWLKWVVKKNENGSRTMLADIEDATQYISRWSTESDIKRELVEHFTMELKNRFVDEITSGISTEDIIKDAREAFRQGMKEKFKGE